MVVFYYEWDSGTRQKKSDKEQFALLLFAKRVKELIAFFQFLLFFAKNEQIALFQKERMPNPGNNIHFLSTIVMVIMVEFEF